MQETEKPFRRRLARKLREAVGVLEVCLCFPKTFPSVSTTKTGAERGREGDCQRERRKCMIGAYDGSCEQNLLRAKNMEEPIRCQNHRTKPIERRFRNSVLLRMSLFEIPRIRNVDCVRSRRTGKGNERLFFVFRGK